MNALKKTLKNTLENPKVWKFLAKSVLFSLFFIVAFNTSHTRFFEENPIFEVPFLAEILIALAFGVFGFHTVPLIAGKIKEWVEKFISDVVSRIVADFWAQQSRRMQRARRNKQKQRKQDREKKNLEMLKEGVLLDTSVLIDGRILDVVKTGFFNYELVVPQSVLDELHLVSDSSDDLKRQRGRRGLDIVNSLKKQVKVRIFKSTGSVAKEEGVDKELIRLAKKYKMKLMTGDFNLNKVAKAASVGVLNINELANAVKSNVLPGEKLKVRIVQKGKESGQGVGYFEDGTMIVVVGAEDKVGKRVNAVVSRVIQTEAGRMVFCELD